jgi:O-antigen/teichoic acid export membrane protein
MVLAIGGTLPFFAVVAIARATAQGYGRFSRLAALQLVEVATKVGVGLAFAAIGYGAVGATLGFLAGGIVGASFGLWTLVVTFRVPPVGVVQMESPRSAGAMFAALFGLAVLLNQDLLAVKLFAPERVLAGYYQAALMLANVPYFLVSSTLVPVLFTRLARTANLAETWPDLVHVLRLVLVFAVPVELVAALRPELVLRLLLPERYVAAAPLLQVMALGNCALMLTAVVSASFEALGRAIVPARILLVTCAIEAVGLAAFVPQFRALGAVALFAASAAASAFVLAIMYLREARPAMSGQPARSLVGPAGAILAVIAFWIISDAVGGTVAGIVLAGSAYLYIVYAMRILPLRPAGMGERG